MINFPTLIVDNFYEEPDKIREFALKQDFLESPGNYPGKRTKPLHELNEELFFGFVTKIMTIYYPDVEVDWNVQTSFWKVNTLDPDPLSPKNMGWIHQDGCLAAGVVYLSPGFDSGLGTKIYEQVSEKKPIDGMSMKKFYSTGEDDKFDENILQNNSCFNETINVSNKYNRLVCFDGNVFHSPSHYYMGNETRLVQVFFIRNIKSKVYSPQKRILENDIISYDSL